MPERRLPAVGGRAVAFSERGQGPPVLLLHGIGSSGSAFDRQIPDLEPSYRCIAWDAPGYGSSEDPPSPPGMAGYAAAAGELLGELDAVPAHVVGVSWGGVIATRLALEHPGVVRSLVLADSSRGSGARPEGAAGMRRRGDELDRVGSGAVAAARAPRLLSPAAPPDLVDRVAGAMAAAIRNPGYRWAAEAMAGTDHLERLADVRIPTLVLVGEHDGVTPVEASRELASAIPGARVEVIPGAGHLANQEQPQAFNDLLRAFLDQAETRTASSAHLPGGTSLR